MFNRLRLAFLPAFMAFVFVAMSISAAMAEEAPQFRVYNSGNHQIYSLYVSPHGTDDWGNDLLDGYLDPGYYVTPLADYTLPSCYQDVLAVYTNGHREHMWNIDVCDNNLRFYY